MKIINFGSINKDYVYQVDNFVKPGETKSSKSVATFIGGKGNNQSVALARAGCKVYHAGLIGTDGEFIKDILNQEGVNTDLIFTIKDAPTGHAIIQVANSGENSIILHGGANKQVTDEIIAKVIDFADPGDWILLQNEINNIPAIMRAAHAKGIGIIFNPAPMTEDVREYPLNLVDILVINESEAQELTGTSDLDDMALTLKRKLPACEILLTQGAEGVLHLKNNSELFLPAFNVDVVDTTAAGDTFLGYFVSKRVCDLLEENETLNIFDSITLGQAAAALAVTRNGAIDSIPKLKTVKNFIADNEE